MSKKRKYSENYVAFGFTFVTDSDKGRNVFYVVKSLPMQV